MALTATRHPVVHELIVVTTDEISAADGNVVARFNETHRILGRTHATIRPALSEIRAAIAAATGTEA